VTPRKRRPAWDSEFPEDWLAEETEEVEQDVLSEIARHGSIAVEPTE
jgi:hypothetical protein